MIIYSYSAAITVLCISLLIDYKKHHSVEFMSEIAPSQPDSPLTAWIKTNLGSLYESAIGGETDFQTTFNSTFSEKASIYLNHAQISREDFESNMTTSRSALSRSSTIDWKDMLEIPTKPEEGASTSGVGITVFIYENLSLTLPPVQPYGIVAGFFVVTRSLKFKIRASDAQNLSHNSFSARSVKEQLSPPTFIHLFYFFFFFDKKGFLKMETRQELLNCFSLPITVQLLSTCRIFLVVCIFSSFNKILALMKCPTFFFILSSLMIDDLAYLCTAAGTIASSCILLDFLATSFRGKKRIEKFT